MLRKQATTDAPIHPLLSDRWSPRSFDNSPVPVGAIHSMLEAARWSPSAGNGQPWSFIVVPRGEEAMFQQLVGCLSEGNVWWAQHAPLLVVSVAQTIRDNGVPNATALYDLGQAVAHLSVQAAALELWVHQMGGFSKDSVRELFAIPEGHEPVTVLAVGGQGDHATLSDEQRERENAPRARKPLADFVFGSTWGEASPLLAEKDTALV